MLPFKFKSVFDIPKKLIVSKSLLPKVTFPLTLKLFKTFKLLLIFTWPVKELVPSTCNLLTIMSPSSSIEATESPEEFLIFSNFISLSEEFAVITIFSPGDPPVTSIFLEVKELAVMSSLTISIWL